MWVFGIYSKEQPVLNNLHTDYIYIHRGQRGAEYLFLFGENGNL